MKILHKIKKWHFGVERTDSSLEAKPKEPALLKEPVGRQLEIDTSKWMDG